MSQDELSNINTEILKQIIGQILTASKNGLIYGYRIRFLHSISLQIFTFNKSNFKKKNLLNLIYEILNKIFKSVKLALNHGKILAAFAIIYRTVLIILKYSKKLNDLNNELDDRTDNNNNNNNNNNNSNNSEDSKLKLAGLDHFIAGMCGGGLVYGGLIDSKFPTFNSSITSQVTLYCCSRVVLAVGKLTAYHLARVLAKREFNSKRKISNINHNSHNNHSHSHINNHHNNRLNKSEFKELSKLKCEKIERNSWIIFSMLIWGGVMTIYDRDPNFLQKSLRLSMEFIYGDKRFGWSEMFNYGR
ncbi:unnamed protein product [[Candida] boidinii]|uniref:Unnamed protein product n=1 Tax=Candida boidinii TaxID=5477 RepID=A0A9W6T0C2_CANBO|nr:hypothetical protein B5S30_g414 [[Candida] boidinii]OWB84732.1 hypothetical protein B5S33_g3384 [[Candida] boidinii]GME69889.1 unnamed protein product [[Candida] boidinii]